jgi:hypothetical protein
MFFFGNEEAYEKQSFELDIVVLELSCRLNYIYLLFSCYAVYVVNITGLGF